MLEEMGIISKCCYKWNSGKSVFLTNMYSNTNNAFETAKYIGKTIKDKTAASKTTFNYFWWWNNY
jgi:hypothetical protein